MNNIWLINLETCISFCQKMCSVCSVLRSVWIPANIVETTYIIRMFFMERTVSFRGISSFHFNYISCIPFEQYSWIPSNTVIPLCPTCLFSYRLRYSTHIYLLKWFTCSDAATCLTSYRYQLIVTFIYTLFFLLTFYFLFVACYI